MLLQNMKNDWQTKKLDEVCEYIARGISPKYIDHSGIFVLNQKCIRNNEVNYAEARRHDVVQKSFPADKFIQLGDVLVNSTGVGTLGRVAQIKSIAEPAVADSHITIVRPFKNIFDMHFFGWSMIFIEDSIKELGAGASGQIELSRITLKEINIAYPESLPEQRRIVKILDETFAAIAAAKENAEKNLQNAREVFESYLQSVFANPGEGWEEKKLGEICEIIMGQSPDGKSYNIDGRGIPLINGPVEFGRKAFSETIKSKYTTQPTKYCKKGDLILCVRGSTTGRTNISGFDACIGRGVAAIRYSKNQWWINYFIMCVRKKIYQLGTGSTFPNISSALLFNMRLPLPPISEQKSIVAKLDALSAETKKLEEIYKKKLADLEELKKSILQKAFSGEL